MTQILEDKVAIVTGAAKGIGLAIAKKLNEAGARVVLADIDGAAADEAAGTLSDCEGVACDVRDENQVSQLVRDTVERHGHLDVMVSNAGIAAVNPLVQVTLEEWRNVLAV